MGLSEAEKWDSEVGVVEVSSVDDNISSSDGKRRKWNMLFASINSESNMAITIEDAKITEKSLNEGKLNSEIVMNIDDIKMDSIEAFQVAIKEYNLKPAVTWAKGYHYYLAKNIETGENVLSVEADNVDGKATKVFFDSKSKKMLGAINKVYTGGGFYKLEKNEAFVLTEEGQSIIGHSLSPDFSQDRTILIWGYSTKKENSEKPIIKISNNNGTNWTKLHIDINTLNGVLFSPDFSENNIIYLFNEKSIFKYSLKTKKIDKIYSNTNIRNVIIHENNLAVLTEREIYTIDLYSKSARKQNLSNTIYSIISNDNKLFAFTIDGIFEKREERWVKLDIPTFGIDGIVLEDKIFTFKDSTISYFMKGNKEWISTDISEPILKLYNSSNGESVYLVTTKGIFEIIEGGGAIKLKEIYRFTDGNITSLSSPMTDFFFLSVAPESKWEKL